MSKERLKEEIKCFRLLYTNNIKTAKWKSLAKRNPSSLAELKELHREYEDEILNYFQKDNLGNLRIGVLIAPEALGMNVPALQQILGQPSSGMMINSITPVNDEAADAISSSMPQSATYGSPPGPDRRLNAVANAAIPNTENAVAIQKHYVEGGMRHALQLPLQETMIINNKYQGKPREDGNVKSRVKIVPGLKHRYYMPKFREPVSNFKIKSSL